VADQNFAFTEKDPGRHPNEVQWQIPFDAGKNIGWTQSATPEESGTAEDNPPATGDSRLNQLK
jgi:hypothetical protein